MTERALRNEYRTTQVCVDDLQDGRFRGRLYNPFWKGCIPFNGVTEFLARMEEQLDLMPFPQSFTARRTFAEVTEKTSARREPLEMRRGEEATFYLRVLFRQNSSWQGDIQWAEGGQKQSFRSVLELLMMMSDRGQKLGSCPTRQKVRSAV